MRVFDPVGHRSPGDLIKDAALPVDRVLVLGPDTASGPTAVPSNGWLTAWTGSARNVIRRGARRADGVHLFISTRRPLPLLLGHSWNVVLPPTTVYEFDGSRHFPTFRLT